MIEARSLKSGKAFLDREEQPFHVDRKLAVELFLGHLSQGCDGAQAGIGEDHIQLAVLLTNRGEQTVEIGHLGHVPLHGQGSWPDQFHCFSQIFLPPTRDDNLSAFLCEQLGGCQPHTAVAARHQRDFSSKLGHDHVP